MTVNRAWLTDAAERVVRAFLVAFLGQYLASKTGLFSLDAAKAAASADIASGLSIILSLLGATSSNGVSPASVVGGRPKAREHGYGIVELLVVVVLLLIIIVVLAPRL